MQIYYRPFHSPINLGLDLRTFIEIDPNIQPLYFIREDSRKRLFLEKKCYFFVSKGPPFNIRP